MKEIVVVGGGTAGWLTALFANKYLPDCNVTVIESSDIGILGAGEGTIPHFARVLEMIDIPLTSIFADASGTTKHGIKFINWNGDESHYYHVFHSDQDVFNHPANVRDSYVPLTFLESISRNESISSSTLQEMMCVENKNPFIIDDDGMQVLEDFALHFNAKELSVLLRETGIERGVKVKDDIIKDIVLEGDIITHLIGKKSEYKPDIVYDCSGFNRAIISKMNSTWLSYKETETVNKAIPFVIPHNNIILEPYTKSLAMKHGWCWIIPVNNRYGCGYTFDRNLATDEEIIEEIREQFPTAKIPGSSFEFESGHYKKSWIGNCIAIGLSAGFIEPLEATSIFATTAAIIDSVMMPNMLFGLNHKYIDEFNTNYEKLSIDIHEFVYCHYITKRDDTEFWKKFSVENSPIGLKEKLDRWKDYPIDSDDLLGRFFSPSSWFQLLQGIDMLPTEVYMEIYNSITLNRDFVSRKFKEEKDRKLERYDLRV